MKKLCIVVPCYNEEEVLPMTVPALEEVVKRLIEKNKVSKKSFILLVDDGSKDRTWELISDAHEKSPHIYGLKLSANRGHQNALMAGLEYAAKVSDMSVSIDADLQDDIDVIEAMVDEYNDGADIVFGVRDDRKTDSFFKRTTGQGFYKVMKGLGVKTVYNHADYRLMSKRALEALLEYGEKNLFLRGIVADLGFNNKSVYYARKSRAAGESKYPLKKMLSFAWDGISSFSRKPLNLICTMGAMISFASFVALICDIVLLAMGKSNQGLYLLGIIICLLIGLQILALGVVGQYVGKAYVESKQRPRYHVMEILNHEDVD